MFLFLLGVLVGIILSAVALVLDACKERPTLVWMDKDLKLHLVKRKMRR